MEIKKNKREVILIILGLLVMVAPWVVFDSLSSIVNFVLGVAVIIVGAWPFIRKVQPKSA